MWIYPGRTCPVGRERISYAWRMSTEPVLTDVADRLAVVASIRRFALSGEMRRRRHAAQVTVTELATTLEISRPTLSCWERGKLTPKPDHALAWETALRRVEGMAVAATEAGS